jgi:radical SAM protein (TIGR01212 family)
MKTLNTFGRYLRRRFGTRVYKISLNLSGFTCPNIDGKVARGGCTYCENESFSPNLGGEKERFFLNMDSKENPLLEKQLRQIELQYKGSREHFRREYGVGKYIAYFQSFSNTYAPLETLKALFEKAIEYEDVVALSIGTRADCVNDELLAYLKTLSARKEIWIEFGVQSIYDKTLERINRGENYAQVKEAILKAKSHGLKVCAHMIFGLPGETPEMMVEGTKEVAKLGIDAIKFHPCYVVKNTMLANEYAQGKFTPIDEETYLNTLVDAVKVLPGSVSIQRVTAGIANDTLIAPAWCGLSKNRQMRRVKEALRHEGLVY